jgi:NitT/TauT family transport system ATP-binding protein
LFVTHQINEAVYLADKVVILGTRPGHIKRTVDISLGRPRALSIKRDLNFLRYEDDIWSTIEEEASKSMSQEDAA